MDNNNKKILHYVCVWYVYKMCIIVAHLYINICEAELSTLYDTDAHLSLCDRQVLPLLLL